MKFAELFEITKTDADDWFDPILNIDTKLFIDPFLIYADEAPEFSESHGEVIAFFDHAFKLIASSHGDDTSNSWRRAKNLLIFPEASEFCLGYTKNGTRGAGSGVGYAKTMAESIWEAIQAGVKEITHFEEIGLLREGIGADRIADITATILRHRFAKYTESICIRHSIPLEERQYKRGIFSLTHKAWIPTSFRLPFNPENNFPLILAPERYLRELPTINSDSFWDYCFDNVNEQLRAEFSSDVLRHVRKRDIVSFAARHPEIRKNFLASTEEDQPDPYDIKTDPRGYVRWYKESNVYCINHPLQAPPTDQSSFIQHIKQIISEFVNFIENNGGWKLLWNENNTPKREEAAQLLFLGLVKHYCRAGNIDISKEVNIGRGPVDFKLSQGFQLKALLELKLAKNSKFWNGIEKQVPIYLKSESIDLGYFLVIVYRDEEIKKLTNVHERAAVVKKQTGYDIKVITVDARRNPLSASKV